MEKILHQLFEDFEERRKYSIKEQMENGLFNEEIMREIKKLKIARKDCEAEEAWMCLQCR